MTRATARLAIETACHAILRRADILVADPEDQHALRLLVRVVIDHRDALIAAVLREHELDSSAATATAVAP
jgi:hypothetical protein